MAMDMDDEKLFRQEHGWSLQLKSGQEITLTPGANEANEPLCVTDVFLVDPESTAGQGVVAAFVEIGTRNILLAALSSERPRVALQTPVVLDEQFCFYLMRPGTDADADAEADAVVVQFQGYAVPSADAKGEVEEDEEEDDMIDDENHEEEQEEESDGNGTEDDEDARGSDDSHYEYDSRDDGEVCGLPLGVELNYAYAPRRDDSEEEFVDRKVRAQAVRERRASHKAQRRRRRFATEAEGRSLGGPAPPGLAFPAERRRRVPLEAALLGIFVFVYLMAMVALYISG
jgi:hypothetical protein